MSILIFILSTFMDFLDENHDGVNDLFVDANGDGVNDVTGESYPHPFPFLDADSDGVNDVYRDADGDGLCDNIVDMDMDGRNDITGIFYTYNNLRGYRFGFVYEEKGIFFEKSSWTERI